MRTYSFDVAPSAEAYRRLRGSTARIVRMSSVDGALAWIRLAGEPIDLLFIDGSHALQHVFEDFNAWVSRLRPGGEVIFHDYDSNERGGLVHLGTHVVLRTILRRGLLMEPSHTDRLLFGRVTRPSEAQLKVGECFETFRDLGREIVRIQDNDYSGWILLGEEPLATLLRSCLRLGSSHASCSIDGVRSSHSVLVFSRPLDGVINALAARGVPGERIVALSSLHLCYVVEGALRERRDDLLAIAASRAEFFRWEEILFMLDHGFGRSEFPEQVPDATRSSIEELSRVVAKEQIRLAILMRLLEGILAEKL